jgi:hypothetical protein
MVPPYDVSVNYTCWILFVMIPVADFHYYQQTVTDKGKKIREDEWHIPQGDTIEQP